MSNNYLEISKEENSQTQNKVSETGTEMFNEQWDPANIVRNELKEFTDLDSQFNRLNYITEFNYQTKYSYPIFENIYAQITALNKAKKASPVELGLSDYLITSEGVINENWSSTVSIPSKIIEINETFVILECLIDYENKTLEKRKFKRSLLEGKCDLYPEYIVIVKISEKPGKIQFEFENGMNLGFEKYFCETDYLTDIDSISIEKAII